MEFNASFVDHADGNQKCRHKQKLKASADHSSDLVQVKASYFQPFKPGGGEKNGYSNLKSQIADRGYEFRYFLAERMDEVDFKKNEDHQVKEESLLTCNKEHHGNHGHIVPKVLITQSRKIESFKEVLGHNRLKQAVNKSE